jgi:hypothetical protein
MTLNQKTIFRKSDFDYPATIKFSEAGAYVNKYCGRILNAPCKVSFEITKKRQLLIIGDKDGIEIIHYASGLMIPSRPLTYKIQEILEVESPRFAVVSTSKKNIFQLILLNKN